MGFAHQHGHGRIVGPEQIDHLVKRHVRYKVTAHHQDVRLKMVGERNDAKMHNVLTYLCPLTEINIVLHKQLAPSFTCKVSWTEKHYNITMTNRIKNLYFSLLFLKQEPKLCRGNLQYELKLYYTYCETYRDSHRRVSLLYHQQQGT